MSFQIFIVPEAATLLFNGGFSYDGSTIHSELAFEANKIKTQIALEDAFMNLAKMSKKPTVIICDRGTMDSRAYIGIEKWHILLQVRRLLFLTMSSLMCSSFFLSGPKLDRPALRCRVPSGDHCYWRGEFLHAS